MLSKLAATTFRGVTATSHIPATAARQAWRATSAFHTSVAACDDAAAEENVLAIDKTNPLYAPDAWDDWKNVGYSNLAPKDMRGWDDLPVPYKYYDVKVDPADVENPGLLWNIFTNWKTALPATGILALPMYLYDIFTVDSHLMLACISWFTFALVRTQFGPAIGEGLMQTIEEEAKEVYDVEAKYRTALSEVREAHQNVLDLVEDLQAKHAAERALRNLEAVAATKELRVEQTLKMKAQLEYLILIKNEIEARAQNSVVGDSFETVANKLRTDKAAQQASINDAIAVLAGEKQFTELGVVKDFEAEIAATVKAVSDAGVPEATAAQYRELFAKKFGYATEVTAAALEAAQASPKEMAVLTAKCGGVAPAVGTPIVTTMPIDRD